MEDGELPALIEMVKTRRGSRMERAAVRLVLGVRRPCKAFVRFRLLEGHTCTHGWSGPLSCALLWLYPYHFWHCHDTFCPG